MNSALKTRLKEAVPRRVRLPIAFWRARFKGIIEPELYAAVHLIPRRRVAIDAGANQGLYSYWLSKRFAAVVAFEPNEAIIADLEHFGSKRIKIIRTGLSSAHGEAVLHVPVAANGFLNSGWGTLYPTALPESARVVQMRVPLATLDSFAVEDVSFLKIDVEGHESEVLAGAIETVKRWRPVILIESKPKGREFLTRFCESNFYQPHVWGDSGNPIALEVGIKDYCGSRENFILTPK